MRQYKLSVPAQPSSPGDASALPLSKLFGFSNQIRMALKVRRITTCGALISVAGQADDRAALASVCHLDLELLTRLVKQADMARVNGIGQVFGQMLRELGIFDVESLAILDPEPLHEQLRQYNDRERLARRSPTPEEVSDWLRQARDLPLLVT